MFQAQSDDDDVGPDDVSVNVEGRDGFMDAFFAEVSVGGSALATGGPGSAGPVWPTLLPDVSAIVANHATLPRVAFANEVTRRSVNHACRHDDGMLRMALTRCSLCLTGGGDTRDDRQDPGERRGGEEEAQRDPVGAAER